MRLRKLRLGQETMGRVGYPEGCITSLAQLIADVQAPAAPL